MFSITIILLLSLSVLVILESFSISPLTNFLHTQIAHSQLESQEVNALLDKADSFYNQQKYSEAMNLYDKVLALEPNNIHALSGKGNAFYAQGKYQEAIISYDRIL